MSTLLWALRVCVLVGCATSTGILAYVMLMQPLLAAPVHGLRGLKRARARSSAGNFKDIEPLMRWVAARISPLLPRAADARLRQKLTIAGELWGLWPAELRALSVLGGIGGAALGALSVVLFGLDPLALPLLCCVGALSPELQLSSVGRKRVHAISRRVPHVVDLLVLALGAGLDFPAALRQVVERCADPESDTMEELGLVLEELKLGSTRRYALEQLARRAPCDEVRDLVAAAVQSEEQGTALSVVLETQAATSRQRRSTRAEEAASKASTAMVVPLVLLFVALIILMIGPVVFDALSSQSDLGGF